MKNTSFIVLSLCSTLLFAPAASAADLYWYPSAPSQGGNGTWNTTLTNWNPNSDGSGSPAVWTNSNSDDAIFGGTAGTVTASVPVTTRSLSFSNSGYILTGSSLTLAGTGGGGIHVASGITTVSNVLSSSLQITKTGSGTLSLSGANTLSGGIYLQQGAMQTTGASGILGSTTLRMSDGTTLISTVASSASVGPTRVVGDGYLIDNGATVTFNTTYSGTASTANNIFAGDASYGNSVTLIKTGQGTLQLNQGSGNFGATTANTWRVDGGMLRLNNNDRLGATSNQILLNGGGITLFGSFTIGRTITLTHLLHFEGMKLASARFLQRGSGEAAVADSKM